jgi:hypothetical protein
MIWFVVTSTTALKSSVCSAEVEIRLELRGNEVQNLNCGNVEWKMQIWSQKMTTKSYVEQKQILESNFNCVQKRLRSTNPVENRN